MVSLQEVLYKSNQIFINFKTAIDKVRSFIFQIRKQISQLEQENQNLNIRSEKSDLTIYDMLVEQRKIHGDVASTRSQIQMLEKLHATLQEKLLSS
jgi:chromosome segregation ATPase